MGVPQILLYLMLVIYFASLWKIFEKAGRKKWEGFVPGYNIWVWLKILNKPWWWIFFFPIPFVNFVITVACNVETARMFGKYAPKDTILTVLVPWYMIPALAYKEENVIVEATDWTKKGDREKRSIHDHLTLFFMAPFVGHALLVVFKLTGSKDKENKKTMPKEWTDALGFAIVAATIIRVFFFEAFTIPTGSMEKTMLIGDYLFVNKLKYGAKIPQTPLSVPFVHNRIPGTYTKSYVEWFKNDYMRLPGYGGIERNDIMVFNWPAGDTVIVHDDAIAHDYYSILRNHAYTMSGQSNYKEFDKIKDVMMTKARDHIASGGALYGNPSGGAPITKTGGVMSHPVDKKENYIKRCVAIGGDTIEIINGTIHINGVAEEIPEYAQFNYWFYFKNYEAAIPFSDKFLYENYEIYPSGIQRGEITAGDSVAGFKNVNVIIMPCSNRIAAELAGMVGVDSASVIWEKKGTDVGYSSLFPNDISIDWTKDNFGPLYIPEAGVTIELNDENYIAYKRAITAYEGNTLQKNAGKYLLNGEVATSYTFKQNYYWLMGDNRHGSADSRYWGYVPEDHVVGTASFVWFSKTAEKGWFDGGVRWSRIFSFIK